MADTSTPPTSGLSGADVDPWAQYTFNPAGGRAQAASAESALDEHLERQIADAGIDAAQAVFSDYISPHSEHPDAYYDAISVQDRAHAAMHQAVRDKAAELGVAPSDYFRANPEAVLAVCRVSCPQDWPEVDSVAHQAHPDDERLSLKDTVLAPIPADEEQVAAHEGVNALSPAETAASEDQRLADQLLAERKNEIASRYRLRNADGDRLFESSTFAPPLDADVASQITQARDRAAQAVRSTYAKRPVQHKKPVMRLDSVDVDIRVHQQQHQAVRTKARELNIEPETYYWRNPDAIADCTVHCLDEWPELVNAAYSPPDEDRLYSIDEDYLAQRDHIEERALVIQVLEDTGGFDHLHEPLELENLPPDMQHELHMRAPVEPLDTDDPAVAQIKAAATRADEAVRAPEAVRAYHERLKEELGADHRPWHRLDTSVSRGHEAWHQAIRDECAVLDVEPGAYFLAVPDEIARCDGDCAHDWPEVTTVAIVYGPGDVHLTLRTEIDDDFIEEQVQEVVAAESYAPGRDEQADWLRRNEHTLDEDPPTSDLGSDLGCGF